jgi:hypothetical protein
MSTDDTSNAFQPLDGNAAAGVLRELFAFEVTTARVTCGGCGKSATVAEAVVYGGTMGAILRCRNCDTAVLRLVHTPQGYWLDMQGTRSVFVQNARA